MVKSMEEYHLFPDIKLVFGSENTSEHSGIGITYCFDGVREYLIDGRYFYLAAGSYIVFHNDEVICSDSSGFRSVTMMIDDKKATENTEVMLFDSRSFTDKLTGYTPYITKADSEIAKLFCDIGEFCKSSDTVMLRIRIIEVLMLISNGLSGIPEDKRKKCMAAAELICNDIAVHYTIPQLAAYSQLNSTTFKESFRLAFGCSVYCYAKCRKMFRAVELLLHTDMKIIDIAAEVGYCNASKFAKAFYDVIGKNPKCFRIDNKRYLNRINNSVAASAGY